MMSFLVALVLLGALIVGGFAVSLYLYSRGSLRSRRLSHARDWVAVKPMIEDTAADHLYMGIGTMDYDETSRYARRGVLVLLAIIVALGMVVTFTLSVVGH